MLCRAHTHAPGGGGVVAYANGLLLLLACVSLSWVATALVDVVKGALRDHFAGELDLDGSHDCAAVSLACCVKVLMCLCTLTLYIQNPLSLEHTAACRVS
jgi:hypothetical protein